MEEENERFRKLHRRTQEAESKVAYLERELEHEIREKDILIRNLERKVQHYRTLYREICEKLPFWVRVLWNI